MEVLIIVYKTETLPIINKRNWTRVTFLVMTVIKAHYYLLCKQRRRCE